MKVRAKIRCFDGVSVREEGDVFEYEGVFPNECLEPVEDAPRRRKKTDEQEPELIA